MRFIILGVSGFVGRNLYRYLLGKFGHNKVVGYDRSKIDFKNPVTFKNYSPLSGDILIDCISKIDGSDSEIEEVNSFGFSKFVDYVKGRREKVQYIYFSTYSTCLADVVNASIYVRTKLFAEYYIRNNFPDSKIVRLIFPFGQGESERRLISRLVKKIRFGEQIAVDQLRFNLTPIKFLLSDFEPLLSLDLKEVNYSNGVEVYLPDLVEQIGKWLKEDIDIRLTDKQLSIVLDATFQDHCSKEDLYNEIKRMIND